MLINPIEFSNFCKKIQSTAENNSYSKIESSASKNFDQKRIATHRELSDGLRQNERGWWLNACVTFLAYQSVLFAACVQLLERLNNIDFDEEIIIYLVIEISRKYYILHFFLLFSLSSSKCAMKKKCNTYLHKFLYSMLLSI